MRIMTMMAAAGALAWAGGASAQPGSHANASDVQFSTGFVCPVISTDNVLHSPKGGELGDTGDYTIGGPDLRVPTHATNGDGTGTPEGAHSAPGDTDYTAIWSLDIDTC